jgi:PAS domain S-box-containing protein
MELDNTLGNNNPDTPFPIVGIGASAGGLHSLDCFLEALPKDFDFAVVFIQHLSPSHKSLMPELLRSKWLDYEFIEIEDGLHLLPGRLYLCPPAVEVRIHKGAFRVVARPDEHIHFPIDEFLVSLAEDAAERAIAVIFSGAGTDGVRGIQAVRTEGGTVFVQDPATAQFPELPQAAIKTGNVDSVLPPPSIAREIVKLLRSGAVTGTTDNLINPAELEPFYLLIREKTGHRFNHYKESVVSRRIRRRMYLKGISSFPEYLNMVADKPGEAALLASDLMIGVTSFFRDRLAWKALRIGVIRKLVVSDGDAPIRVWTPACATGEESYSIAMMLRDELELAGRKRELQVFATDVNDRALEKAREGKYPASISADVSQDFMRKFFTYSDDGISVTVSKEMRQHVIFAKQDILTDPPFSRLDLVICRNLLIYLEPDAQEKCITLFHYALRPGGYLFLGNAESLGRKVILFKSLAHKKCRVYEKVETGPSSRLPLSVPFAAERTTVPVMQQPALDQLHSLVQLSQDSLLEKYGPAAVTINQNYNIIYNNGPTKRYLTHPRGATTNNLLELLPESLRNRIRGAIYKATQEAGTFTIRAGITSDEGQKRQVAIHVSKIKENLFLIVFREKEGVPSGALSETTETICVEEPAVRQLEIELSSTRQELQSNIEQLKSLNEEFHSSNEELQASNEELETSREELQSLNEELITVNTQLQSKVEEQEETNNDLNNFLSSTNIPTIFLDHSFRVKRYTPAITKLVKLIPSDVGRQIIDMSQEALGPDIISDAQSVLENLIPVKKEIRINNDWYVRIALPYRTFDDHIEGVVVTYNDVTELKRAEERSSHLASFPQLNPNPVIEIDSSGKVSFFNQGTLETLESLGMDKGEVDAFLPPDLAATLRDWDKGNEVTIHREITIKDRVFGETIYLFPQFNVARIYAVDITERKKVEWERETAVDFLRLVNESRKTVELVRAATAFFQERAGCEAVGIRLRDEHDYPYFETKGFPAEFVRAESRLCACDKDGRPILDNAGNPVLECMCGNVICGRFDPSKPFFTKRGNFWTNSTTALLAGTTEKDRQSRTRNRCHGEGYESVALIGLSLGDQRLGLLQLNDKRKNRFTPESIALWERLGDYLAVALAKFGADEELQESEEQFRTLADSIPNLAWWANGDGYITWYNRRWYEYTGTTPEQMEGWGWQSVHDPEVLPKVLERWKTSIDTGEPFDMEFPLRGADGIFRPFLTRIMPVKDSAGVVVRWFGTNTDVSALKQAEAVQGRLAAIVESAEDAIIGKDLNGIIQTWNAGAENIFGYEAEEIIGKSISLLVPPGHTDDVPGILERIKQGEHIEHFETVRMRKDGTIIPVSLAFSAVRDVSGRVIGASKIAHDITERKQAELELEKLAQQRQLALDAARMGWWHYDPITRISSWDEGYKKIFGVTGYQQPNEEILARIHAEDLPGVWAKVEAALNPVNPRPYFAEYRINLPDGSMRWIEAHGIAAFEGSGENRQATSFVGTVSDITERKRVEEEIKALLIAVQQEKDKMSSLINSITDEVWFADTQGRFTIANPSALKEFGISSGDIVEVEKLEKSLEVFRPDGSPRPVEESPPLRGLSGEVIRNQEEIVRTPATGELRHREVSTTPVRDTKGKIIGSVSIVHDITERKRAEEKLKESEQLYRAIGESIDYGVWVCDPVGRNIYASESFLKLVGLTQEQCSNFGWGDVLHPEDAERTIAAWQECVRTMGNWDIEHRFRGVDGQWHPILARGVPVKNERGEVIYWAGINLDIKRIRQAEEEIKKLNDALLVRNDKLEFANKELESFIYSVSHDLRGPLRHIAGFAEIVMKNIADKVGEKDKRYLALIHDGTKKMGRLIDDLLNLSRMSRQDIQRKLINLSAMASSIVADLREAHPTRNVEVDIKEGLTANADPGLMEVVLSNLLGNAWKFTGKTEYARIEFGTIEQDGKITYYVRDNGAGFNQEYVGKMFWPFHRLHSEAAFEGTGIGLAIVDRIITRHGGKVWAEGVEGKGATIYFSFT